MNGSGSDRFDPEHGRPSTCLRTENPVNIEIAYDDNIDLLEALTRLPEERPEETRAMRSCWSSNLSRRWTI